MEKLKKAINNISSESLDHFKELFDINKDGELLGKLLTIRGIDQILSSLSETEMRILYILAQNKEGLTFSEIEKEIKIPVSEIEAISEKLKDKFLVYILKNRKHLNNRFDKAHIFEPIFDILNRTYSNDSLKILSSIGTALKESGSEKIKIKDKGKILETIYNEGSIVSFEQLQKLFPDINLSTVLEEFEEKEMLFINFALQYPYNTMIILNWPAIAYFTEKSASTDKTVHFNNRHSIVLNILHLYDIVSSHGLFLTQQDKFRKTDVKRITQQLVTLFDHNNNPLEAEECFQFILSLLYSLDLITENKTNIFLSLERFHELLGTPSKIVDIILDEYRDHIGVTKYQSPFALPPRKYTEYLLQHMKKAGHENINLTRQLFIIDHSLDECDYLPGCEGKAAFYSKQFENTLKFLTLCGKIERKGAIISYAKEEREDSKPSIYINPDFSLIIPKNETSPQEQYIILAYSTIMKDDVILSAKITKESILNAHKRGMSTDLLNSTLKSTAKNDVPQNMLFLIDEWIQQTLDVAIQYGTIIEVNHPTFLDELDYKQPGVITKRLSESCAIIDRSRIDDIVKLAEKHKAITKIEKIESSNPE